MASASLALVFALGYVMLSAKDSLTDRIIKIETSSFEADTQVKEESAITAKKMANLLTDLEEIKESIGVTSAEAKRARETAQMLRRQQEQAAKELAGRLAEKA